MVQMFICGLSSILPLSLSPPPTLVAGDASCLLLSCLHSGTKWEVRCRYWGESLGAVQQRAEAAREEGSRKSMPGRNLLSRRQQTPGLVGTQQYAEKLGLGIPGVTNEAGFTKYLGTLVLPSVNWMCQGKLPCPFTHVLHSKLGIVCLHKEYSLCLSLNCKDGTRQGLSRGGPWKFRWGRQTVHTYLNFDSSRKRGGRHLGLIRCKEIPTKKADSPEVFEKYEQEA